MNNILQQYFIETIKNNSKTYYKDFLKAQKKLKNSNAIFNGEHVDFLYQALFFDLEEYNKFDKLLNELQKILDKVILRYLEKASFRKHFKFSPLLEKLILKNPGYDYFYPIGRFDLFYKNQEYKFCELNTDGSSAMNEIRVIQDVIKNTEIIKKLKEDILNKKDKKLSGFKLFYPLIDIILKNYSQYAKYNESVSKSPQIAIVDFNGEGVIHEFQEFQKRFNKKGYKTIICDPRQLEYKNNHLYCDDFRVDLIYRRATTGRIIDEAEDIQDFLDAYLNGDVCVVGSFRSQVIHNKRIFAVLHNERAVNFLSEKEKEFINNHIPYTEIVNLTDSKVMNKVKSLKDKFILKPFDRLAGKGVHAGKDYSQQEWDVLLKKIKNRDYILQEFIDVPRMKMPIAQKENMDFDNFAYILGFYVYNKKLNGIYTRTSRNNIIAAAGECFTIANYIVDRED